ncbi:hypothetical protein ABG768_010680 [Culter alburnus]|uniref:Uncharacterized protein n=1 Tax=Culter alburnus TaxID=194366 RepID=A0AAW1ZEU3_CULAL
MVKKLQEKSPLKFPVVMAIACLEPTSMHRDPEWCLTKMKTTVQKFLQDNQLAGGFSAGDVTVQQFASFLLRLEMSVSSPFSHCSSGLTCSCTQQSASITLSWQSSVRAF